MPAFITDNNGSSGSSFNNNFSFQSQDDGVAPVILDSTKDTSNEDVFGQSLAEFDVWDCMEPPAPVVKKKPKGREYREETSTSTSTSTTNKRRSRDGKKKTKKTKSQSDLPELAPMLDMTTNTSRTSKSRSSSSSSKPSRRRSDEQPSSKSNVVGNPSNSDDRIGELMSLIRKESGTEAPGAAAPSSQKLTVPTSPHRLKKKLLEERNGGKASSYLPKRVNNRIYGADFRNKSQDRRDRVKDSLKRFLYDTSSSDSFPPKNTGRSVHSAPTSTMSVSTSKSRRRPGARRSHPSAGVSKNRAGSSRRLQASCSGGLEAHLQSTWTKKTADGEQRSVVSAPAAASTAALSEKCQKLKMIF